MNTGRLESFSDGVMAVAITLLVLYIKVPNEHLAHELGAQWPTYLAYVTSFLTIGIIWINHHVMISRLARADHSILMLNLLLLMAIAAIPFGTDLVATYLRQASGANLAAAIYGAILLAMALTFAALNSHILFRRSHLLKTPLSLEGRRRVIWRGTAGVLPYVAATALSVVSPYITVAITGAVAVFYALPIASTPDG